MKMVSFHHKDTGIFHGKTLVVSDESVIAANTPPEHVAIEGHHDRHCKRVDVATGRVVDGGAPREISPESKLSMIYHQIRLLEASIPRALLQHALGYEGSLLKLKQIDEAIAALEASVA